MAGPARSEWRREQPGRPKRWRAWLASQAYCREKRPGCHTSFLRAGTAHTASCFLWRSLVGRAEEEKMNYGSTVG